MCKDEKEDVTCSVFRVKHMKISEKMYRCLTRQLLLVFRTLCQLMTFGLFGILSSFFVQRFAKEKRYCNLANWQIKKM